jgi:hypothetical protein
MRVIQCPKERRNYACIVTKKITLLRTIGGCRKKRRGTVRSNLKIKPMVIVRPMLFSVINLMVIA